MQRNTENMDNKMDPKTKKRMLVKDGTKIPPSKKTTTANSPNYNHYFTKNSEINKATSSSSLQSNRSNQNLQKIVEKKQSNIIIIFTMSHQTSTLH